VELFRGLLEIALQVCLIDVLVEAVDRFAPESKSSPVEHAGCEILVPREGSQLSVEALESGAVAFVVGLLNLRHNSDYGFSFGAQWARKGRCASDDKNSCSD